MIRPTRVLIDTDGGQDDAIAILAALSPGSGLTIEAISTVAGNSGLDVATDNVARVLGFARSVGLPAPAIHRGSRRPLVGRDVDRYFDDADGLPGWPETTAPIDPDRLGAIDRLRDLAWPATICALGPLTNIAFALMADPGLVERIERIVLMGGSIGSGNITDAAEFNILMDPEAAEIVFSAGLDVVVVPSDTCERARFTADDIDQLASAPSPLAAPVGALLRAMGNAHDHERYQRHGTPVYDLCAVMYLIAPDLFETRPASVEVECSDLRQRGRTDFGFDDPTGSLVDVVTDIDGPAFRAAVHAVLRG